MDAQVIVRTAVVVLAIAALGGLAMAAIRLAGRPHPPAFLAMAHGVFAASGLTLVLLVAFTAGLPARAWWGTVLLLGAAAVGLVLNLGYHWRSRALPVWLMAVHAAVAVVGFVLLVLGGWGS